MGDVYSKIALPDSAQFISGKLHTACQNNTNKHLETEAMNSRPALSTEIVPGQPLAT